MSKHLTGVMVAVISAASLLTAPTFADHRPGNVVVMGGTVSLTGRYVEPAGRQFNGVKLYVDELNESGGLLGHRVKLKIYDDKTDKRTAIELYQRLITEDRVDLVLGPYGSLLTDPVANVTERYRHPIVVGNAGNPAIWERGRKFVFSAPQPNIRDRFKGALYVAKKIGVEKIAIIAAAGPYSRKVFVGAQEWVKRLGLNVVFVGRYPGKGIYVPRDFIHLYQGIMAKGADAILVIGGYPDTVAQLRQLRELNIDVKMFAAQIAPSLPKFIEELGSMAEFVVGLPRWLPKPVLAYHGIAEFVENYEKRYGVKPNYHAAGGYASMQIFVAAVKEVGSFDPVKVRDALATIRVETVEGPWKANERGVSAPTERVAFQIQNGKRVIVWPDYAAEARFLPMPKWADRAKK